MGADSSKEKKKFWDNKLVGMGKEEARYFIQDNDVFFRANNELITEIRVSERDGKIYEFSKVYKNGRINVRLEKHRIVLIRRMG